MKIYIKIIPLLLLILRGDISIAQTTVQVVTKTIEKVLPYKSGNTVNIDAEKAEVTLKTDAKLKQITIKIELISKHPTLETAKKDLDAMKYITEAMGNNIYIRNYVAIAKGSEKPSSDLKTRYFIVVPPDAAVSIKNNFGKLNVSDLKSKLNIVVEFCKTILTDIKGDITINARLGDIEANRLDGNIKIQSNRSDITLSILKGSCDIQAQYGKIRVDADRAFTRLNVKAEKADVYFSPPTGLSVAYLLDAEYGKVLMPKTLNIKYLEKSKTREKVDYKQTAYRSEVSVLTTFGTIEIGN
jgi:phage-related protein